MQEEPEGRSCKKSQREGIKRKVGRTEGEREKGGRRRMGSKNKEKRKMTLWRKPRTERIIHYRKYPGVGGA